MVFHIAIDGPAAAGKTTLAKRIAHDLKIFYLDTGAMYRGVALWMLQHGIDCNDHDAVLSVLDDVKIETSDFNGEMQVCINGLNVTPKIRTSEVSMAASNVSRFPEVRAKLVKMQQEAVAGRSAVAEGRDICSVVMPDALLKIYLDCDVEERAWRRTFQVSAAKKWDEILRELKERDSQDSSREVSPLKQADDAVYIDSTKMSPDGVAAKVYMELLGKFIDYELQNS